MITGRVIGTVVANAKEENLLGIKLLVVRLIENGKETKIEIAADATRQAGEGDFVYMIGKKEAARIFRKQYTPVDWAIAGFIDTYNEEL